MTRSSRHLIRSQDHGEYTAYCGERSRSDHYFTNSAEWPDLCSKCSSKYYAEQAKSLAYRLGDRLDLSRDGRRYSYKSVYHVHDATNAVIGFITIKNGWGKDWHVHAWNSFATIGDVERNEVPQPVMAHEAVKYRTKPEHGDREYGGSFSSKEQALCAVPLMAEQGKLPSRDAILAKTTEQVAVMRRNLAAQDARRKQLADQRDEQMRLIQEEFAAMLASGELTNRQHTALTTAAELLGAKLTQTAD